MAKIKKIYVGKTDYEHCKRIAKKYFALRDKIEEFYLDEDDNDPQETGKPAKNPGDLCDIGELAANEFGFM